MHIPSYSQSKIYQEILNDLIASSVEMKYLRKKARKNRSAKFKLNRIISDVLESRLNKQTLNSTN